MIKNKFTFPTSSLPLAFFSAETATFSTFKLVVKGNTVVLVQQDFCITSYILCTKFCPVHTVQKEMENAPLLYSGTVKHLQNLLR